MDTIILKIESDFKEEELEEAVKILRLGGLVAFPTETVYGIGANAYDVEASKKIYAAKGRPSDNPLIVHIANPKDMSRIAVDIPKKAYLLADAFWPGPLTIILNKHKRLPYDTTGGLDTVGIRMPDNSIARAMIEQSNIFVAAPSANISGRPSPTKAEHVVEDLYGKVDMIIDGGQATLGLESTIIDLTQELPVILRPGFITKDQIEEVIGQVKEETLVKDDCNNLKQGPKAPGMKYKHYAPKGDLRIYEGERKKVIDTINSLAKEKVEQGYTVGIIATNESKDEYEYGIIKTIGTRKDEATIASGLFNILREFDHMNAEYIYSESFADNQLGHAIMNRLLKAANYHVIEV